MITLMLIFVKHWSLLSIHNTKKIVKKLNANFFHKTGNNNLKT